jgi:putative ABC transport system ATP-binding protein
MSQTPIVHVADLVKDYGLGGQVVRAVAGVSLDIRRGEFVAIMGASGSGKSTFLNLLGCLDKPTSGRYVLDDVDVSRMSDDALAGIRNRKIGFVFQNFNLLARTSALDNVQLPMVYAGKSRAARAKRAAELLSQVGLAARLDHHPAQLSGGQQQRVAIARALVNDPVMILADEPTGALDSRTSHEIMGLLQELNRGGRTIVMVTHEENIARHARRIISFSDGVVVEDRPVAEPLNAIAPKREVA